MTAQDRSHTNAAINLRLSLLGLPLPDDADGSTETAMVAPLLARQRELSRRLKQQLSAPDKRIQAFLDDYLADTGLQPQLPRTTLVLDEPGLARGLSLPVDGDEFHSPVIESYRLVNGVLHNPKNDRRTTAGVFHIATGGLPIPQDKIEVDKTVFARILDAALQAPDDELMLPYTATMDTPAHCWVSLLMRPVVVPEVPGRTRRRSYEVRFIAPGGLVANLDFVEVVFGNGGDPYLPENDASLDPASWTGTTGCVILAPHLVGTLTKKGLGLPAWDDATERQRRDGQCWRDPDELYNDGRSFKICARDERGVMVTVLADNYFGYCKKEVKTQISYSANLLGCAEEEHSGGAITYPAWNLGVEFTDRTPDEWTLDDALARNPDRFEVQPEGHAIDRKWPNIVLLPEHAHFSMRDQRITWTRNGVEQSIKLLADKQYLSPDGYRVHAKHREMDATQWHLIGVSQDPTQCHKPATVSGGGKSEISKSIADAFQFGNAYASDFESDMDAVDELLAGDYSNRFADASKNGTDHRPVLSTERSLGSVIKLLTPSRAYTEEYNSFLRGIDQDVKELAFIVKRYYRPEWGGDWRSHFTVGIMNGRHGNMVRLDGEKVIVNMLRVGFEPDGSWRLFSLRPDFSPAVKVQSEDDITASTVTPPWEDPQGTPRKYVENCEMLLFQRPDDAIHRGYDKQAEHDLSSGDDTFISNFEPLTRAQAREMLTDVQALSEFTEPVQELIARAAGADDESPAFWTCSDEPRHLPDGTRSKNPRYLQKRPVDANPEMTAVADVASRLFRKLPLEGPAPLPIDLVAAGRRNNPPEERIPALCAYNPLHYMELPELFMEFISSMTGKSPSTTGAGSEGALTKGPFNALAPIVDLNAALLSYVLTGYDGWLSSAGYIGPNVRVDHDISMLVPELFSHMKPAERDARTLIEQGFLDKLEDFEFNGRTVRASRLGYRMNDRLATTYFGRIFLHPDVVFTDEMLRPELQDEQIYADSIDVIVQTHQRVAQLYIDDGTISEAVPPLRGLLEIMATGSTSEGWTLDSPEFRALFTRESMLASDWYAARLDAKQAEDLRLAHEGIERLREYIDRPDAVSTAERIGLPQRLADLEETAQRIASDEYRASLVGTVGRQVDFH